MVERRGACGVLVGKLEANRPLGRRRYRWNDNIKINFNETVRKHGLDSHDSGWGQVMGPCERGNEP
jgi:hypothetical protein